MYSAWHIFETKRFVQRAPAMVMFQRCALAQKDTQMPLGIKQTRCSETTIPHATIVSAAVRAPEAL